MNKKYILKDSYTLAIIAFVMISFLSSIYFILLDYEKKIENEMFKIATLDVLQITENKAYFIKNILGESDDYIDKIKSDEKVRLFLENSIKNLITDHIKYAYILYKDKNDIFRFLVDASPEDEKSMLNQKFDVASNEWFELYANKEPTIIKHKMLQKLSISYLVPILNNEKVELVLAIDFSINKIKEINQIITIIKYGIILILTIMVLFLSVLIFQRIKYKTIKKSSFIDKLTNVYNRNYLSEIEAKINLDEYILAILDIDHFKKVNDTYGHQVGDIVLKEIGQILINATRENKDIVIRYGGEEFIIMLKTKVENTEVAHTIIKRILSDIRSNKFFINGEDYIQVTVSIGVNMSPGKAANFMKAFKLADLALYDVKNSGRNRIKISEEGSEPTI